MTNVRCYLCGEEIPPDEVISKDHVVPKQLLDGQQPKRKGFDYAGFIKTHERCNNEFGPENYAQMALELIPALHDPSAFLRAPHPTDPSASFLILNAGFFKRFDQRALKYFKIIDRRNDSQPFPVLGELESRAKANPIQQSVNVALSVLAKSSAALIISRKLKAVPTEWKILAAMYVGDTNRLDFNEIIGKTAPFGEGVKVWLGRMETNDYFVAYVAEKVLVFFLFRFSTTMQAWRHMKLRFQHASRFTFYGTCINDLLSNGWRRV